MTMKLSVLTFVILAHYSFGANILGLISLPSGSHLVWNKNLYQALAARGHNITVLAADVDKKNDNKNIHYIHADAYSRFDSVSLLDMVSDGMSPFFAVMFTGNYYETSCRGFLASDGFKTLLNYPDNFKFDLVV